MASHLGEPHAADDAANENPELRRQAKFPIYLPAPQPRRSPAGGHIGPAPSSRYAAAALCAVHVRELGGESPLPSLMVAKG
jgi:hypothetical protein